MEKGKRNPRKSTPSLLENLEHLLASAFTMPTPTHSAETLLHRFGANWKALIMNHGMTMYDFVIRAFLLHFGCNETRKIAGVSSLAAISYHSHIIQFAGPVYHYVHQLVQDYLVLVDESLSTTRLTRACVGFSSRNNW